MYHAFDVDRNKVVYKHMKYGMLLSYLISCGYYDPDSYRIIWKEV